MAMGVTGHFCCYCCWRITHFTALCAAELMMADAVGLVNTLDNWRVVDKIIMSTKTPEKKRIFGKGNFQSLTEKIRQTAGITAVFVNVERLSPLSEFEEAWGVKVFDRYSVVLHIFRCNARTKEAKYGHVWMYVCVCVCVCVCVYVCTLIEVQQRLLKEREMKIRSALEKLRRKRHLLRSQRKHKEFPIISVLGYTNCGKNTLIKALTGDNGLQPRNQLFATLDVTVHLPHQLIDSFSATLEDIKHSDLLVHVRDISHPETVNQKVNVLSVLKNMQIPDRLMSSMIEVHNKIDLIDKVKMQKIWGGSQVFYLIAPRLNKKMFWSVFLKAVSERLFLPRGARRDLRKLKAVDNSAHTADKFHVKSYPSKTHFLVSSLLASLLLVSHPCFLSGMD
uniref:GTP binding protein 6 (putative) n=1 Tax=Sander lucioperca TaxID=283035 RepID=A0A8D0AIC8_SANLU